MCSSLKWQFNRFCKLFDWIFKNFFLIQSVFYNLIKFYPQLKGKIKRDLIYEITNLTFITDNVRAIYYVVSVNRPFNVFAFHFVFYANYSWSIISFVWDICTMIYVINLSLSLKFEQNLKVYGTSEILYPYLKNINIDQKRLLGIISTVRLTTPVWLCWSIWIRIFWFNFIRFCKWVSE